MAVEKPKRTPVLLFGVLIGNEAPPLQEAEPDA